MKKLFTTFYKLFCAIFPKLRLYTITKNRTGRMDFLLEDLKSRGLNCKAILDVGANTAEWSRMAKKVFSDTNFYLIEPQVEMEKNLKAFVNDFPSSRYFLNGAGPKKEVLTFTVYDDYAGSSFLPKEDTTQMQSGKQRKIDIERIDDLLKDNNIPIPELIKLDIQGYELEALKGAQSTFGKTEVYILEVSLFPFSDLPGMPTFTDIVNYMLQYGYVVYDFPGFLRRPLDGALGQCDICFVKQDGFLRKNIDWK